MLKCGGYYISEDTPLELIPEKERAYEAKRRDFRDGVMRLTEKSELRCKDVLDMFRVLQDYYGNLAIGVEIDKVAETRTSRLMGSQTD